MEEKTQQNVVMVEPWMHMGQILYVAIQIASTIKQNITKLNVTLKKIALLTPMALRTHVFLLISILRFCGNVQVSS
jgi:hypothetical protein